MTMQERDDGPAYEPEDIEGRAARAIDTTGLVARLEKRQPAAEPDRYAKAAEATMRELTTICEHFVTVKYETMMMFCEKLAGDSKGGQTADELHKLLFTKSKEYILELNKRNAG